MEDEQTAAKTSLAPALKAAAPMPSYADPVYIPLKVFADLNALQYGVELMAGFYHVQEQAMHFADTEENWRLLMDVFKNKEVM